MRVESDDRERKLLVALQRGIPIVTRPFVALGAELGFTELEVLERINRLFDSGTARRFGAVFDSRSLGYGSTLCAVDVPDSDLERTAALLAPNTGVTHCYQREGRPNLWFTLTAQAARMREELAALAAALAPMELRDLPALRRFKVEVVLDAPAPDAADGSAVGAMSTDVAPACREFSEREKAVVRALQGSVPVVAAPFEAVAEQMDEDPVWLLALVTHWKRSGALRRIGVILRHREAGFSANGMCVWQVAEPDIERVGITLAAAPEVTHCYQRPAFPGFPYNMFAMVHARETDAAQAIFRRLAESIGLSNGRMLTSVREFKKSSPVFFCEGFAGDVGEFDE